MNFICVLWSRKDERGSNVHFPPIADIPATDHASQMRCFYVLVHGTLDWQAAADAEKEEAFRPAGFYCHRYVLASDAKAASERAFGRVLANLEKETGWLSSGAVKVSLEAEEVAVAAVHKLLKPDNLGNSFYLED